MTHFTQLVETDEPVTPELVPVAHFVQLAAEVTEENRPAPQGSQTLLPETE